MTQIIGFIWGGQVKVQKQLVRRVASKLGAEPDTIPYFHERNTGRRSQWVELEEAIYACRNLILQNQQPLLVISRLNSQELKLRRNLTVLTLLDNAGVDFVMADLLLDGIDFGEQTLGHAMQPSEIWNDIKLHMGLNPEFVRKARQFSEAQSIRKQAEMLARKNAGLPVGAENENSQNLTQVDRLIGSKRGGEATRQKAIEAYAAIAEIVRSKHAEGNSLRAIAKFLNDNDHRTRKGKLFSQTQVALILKRMGGAKN